MRSPVLQLALLAGLCAASMPHYRFRDRGSDRTAKPATVARQAKTVTEYIDTPIDHFPHDPRYQPHTNGTFKQYYIADSTHYKPGGPVVLYISGETSAQSRLSNLQTGIVQILMNATGGLGVILENRYYGRSWPFNSSSTDNLAYMTNEQTIADIAYFAQHARFTNVTADVTAPGTPWILYGGSLAGAQTAFAIKTYGDILYGGIASSGNIYAAVDYPQWYKPIQKYAPSDCVASVNDIVNKLDDLVAAGNTAAIQELKAIFGLESVADIRDFAVTIALPLSGNDAWQELTWEPRYQYTGFWAFCSNLTNLDAPAELAAVDQSMAKYSGDKPWTNLGNYADYVKRVVLPTCSSGEYNSIECFGTQNKSAWADTTNGEGRSYLYTTCVEGGAYQTAPKHGRSVISRVLNTNYTQEWCTWAFPPGSYNTVPSTPDLDRWNGYGGLDFHADRLAFVDGEIDPWLDACYHSETAPERYTSDLHPEYLIAGAGHHWDSSGIRNVAGEPQFIREVHLWEIRTVRKWLRDFPGWKHKR